MTNWTGLLDDAAIFPPGNAPFDLAVPRHAGYQANWYADLLGPFIVDAARWPQLVPHLQTGAVIEVALIAAADDVGRAAAAVAAEPGARLTAVEVPPPSGQSFIEDLRKAGLAPAVQVAVEVPYDERRTQMLNALADSGYRVKLRTGGTSADAFPRPAELAASILAVQERDLTFKATAGLHRAVSHVDPATGFAHYGFLNVLLAAAAARDGAALDGVVVELTDADAQGVARRAGEVDPTTRGFFTSFGTCSIDEPVADLLSLGLLTAPTLETIHT